MEYIFFIFERLDWSSVFDILLVTAIFYAILKMLQDTQAIVLLRGVLLFIALIGVLTSLKVLPAFSWLVSNTLPALIVVIPVIFAPEIRRALERLGRTSNLVTTRSDAGMEVIDALVNAVSRLSDRKHGALIVLQRLDNNLQEYQKSGVLLNAQVSPELLLQIFYPNTPLHDGAVIIKDQLILAASCVMPLSTSGSLVTTPEREMGLRHRAALGTSEVGDAVALVVSEENGAISIAHRGRMISKLTGPRLRNILSTFYEPARKRKSFMTYLARFIPGLASHTREEDNER